jgi:hypothetical protein
MLSLPSSFRDTSRSRKASNLEQIIEVIAKFGLCIALTSLLSSCFMFADSRTGTVITIVLSCISASLWMGMKLTLEKAEGKREEHVQNSANSKVSQMQKLSEVITDNS